MDHGLALRKVANKACQCICNYCKIWLHIYIHLFEVSNHDRSHGELHLFFNYARISNAYHRIVV